VNPALITLAIQETPSLVGLFKDLFATRHPDQPEPTDEEVIAAFQQAFTSSLAKDEAWLTVHPPTA
jgi:hypothetical protein